MNPLERMALLLHLMRTVLDRSGHRYLNKTQVQKLTYLAQALGLESGFEFRMHHYGPYSFDLEGTTQALKGYKLIDCDLSDYETYQEYSFSVGEKAQLFVDGVGSVSEKQRQVIESVADLFASKTTGELELLGTVHLVDCLLMQSSGTKPTQDVVVNTVHALKPRFSSGDVGGAYMELASMHLI
jgi:uncharacterized protein YwgA